MSALSILYWEEEIVQTKISAECKKQNKEETAHFCEFWFVAKAVTDTKLLSSCVVCSCVVIFVFQNIFGIAVCPVTPLELHCFPWNLPAGGVWKRISCAVFRVNKLLIWSSFHIQVRQGWLNLTILLVNSILNMARTLNNTRGANNCFKFVFLCFVFL